MELRLEATKTVDNKQMNFYKIGRYTVRQVVYQDGSFYMEVRAEKDDYLPAIYTRDDLQCNVLGFEIQTTSYGALSAEETKRMIAALNEAVEVAEVLTAKFVEKKSTMFYVYMDNPYGTELIGSSEDRKEAERIKAEQDAKWEPGFLWSTRITDKKEKEFSCFD